jgi:hypothetical protein
VPEEDDVIEYGHPVPSRAWPALFQRRPPAWITGSVAGVAAAAMIAVIVIAATGSSSPAREYATLPDACTLVRTATLGKYLPGAAGGPQQARPGGSSCTWADSGGNGQRVLYLDVELYNSSNAASSARDVMTATLTARHSAPVPVAGLGDHATAEVQSLAAGTQTVRVVVWSGNAEISLVYLVTASPGSARLTTVTQLADVTAIARDSLSVLAHPRPAASASPSRGPRYGSVVYPCALLTRATVTRYVPGALPGTQLPSQDQPVQGSGPWAPGVLSSQLPVQPGGDCAWSANSARPDSLEVAVSIYGSATGLMGAEQNFGTDLHSQEQSIPGSSMVTGTQQLTGLGNQATAVYANRTGNGPVTRSVALLTWSGNAEVVVTYTVPAAGSHPPISRPDLLAAATAVTRDVLSALPRTP